MQRATERLLPWLFGCLLLAGCDRLREVKRCRELAREVNAKLALVEAEGARGEQNDALERISKHYTALAQSVDGFDAGSSELERAVAELEVLARNASRQVHLLKQAEESGNELSADVARRELDRLARQEKLLATRIDEECKAK